MKDMVQRARNAFRAEMPGTDAWLWPNNVYVTAKVIGGMVWAVMGRLKWMDRQRFAMTASGYELERHGLEYGIGRKPASFAQGNIVVTAESWPLTIPANTVFVRDNGVQYRTTLERSVDKYTLAVMIPVIAVTAGRAGNATFGTPLSTVFAGIASSAVDDIGIGQGADLETDDLLRTRILNRKRYPPHGGAAYDYVAWLLALPGITRVFPVGNAYGRGTVGVWFMMDDTYPAGIPGPADVVAAQAALNAERPVTATVIVQAPIADCIDVVVKGLRPDTQAVRESVGAELQALFRNMTEPGVPGRPFALRRSWIWQAIGNAAGESSHEVLAPASDLEFGAGIVPCLRSVSFVP